MNTFHQTHPKQNSSGRRPEQSRTLTGLCEFVGQRVCARHVVGERGALVVVRHQLQVVDHRRQEVCLAQVGACRPPGQVRSARVRSGQLGLVTNTEADRKLALPPQRPGRQCEYLMFLLEIDMDR